MVGGFQFVFKAVVIGIVIAVLAELAEVAEFEPVGQMVGIAILRGGQIGGGGKVRGGHGNAVDLQAGRGAVGGPAHAIERPPCEGERVVAGGMAFGGP